MQIDILNGIYADTRPEFRTSYPVNLIPVPKSTGIAQSFLRPADGIIKVATGPGADRGGIVWNGQHFRAMGTHLVTFDGISTTSIGNVGGTTRAKFDYSFSHLAIASGNALFLSTGKSVTQVTDPDLGDVLDVIWIDGYFMTTDGASLIVTELTNPFEINPLKYGSSEADPDPVVALLKIRNEAAAVNRHTIEFFDNVGGQLFPFQRIEGAQIQKGAVGGNACCVHDDVIAFVGNARNEAVSIYLGANAQAVKIATHEIDLLLGRYDDQQLAEIEVESRSYGAHRFVYVHLPDRTLVYDSSASSAMEQPVWFTLTTAAVGFSAYQGRHFTLDGGQWYCGHGDRIGRLDRDVSTHWGQKVRWEFGTSIIYNKSAGALFHQLEVVALTGSVSVGETALISTSYSIDGVDWSQDRVIDAGSAGQRSKRLVWFQQGAMRNWRVQRFRGDSDIRLSPTCLEARLEPLAY